MKFFIDAGHGGDDPGAEGMMSYYGAEAQKVTESNLALDLAEAVGNYLEQAFEAEVIMSRTADTTIGINSRSKSAHDNDVDAVLSIHFNASGTGLARGVETYYAKTRADDYNFAKAIQDSVVATFNSRSRGVKDDTLTAVGSLGILRNYSSDTYPRALIEVEFIDNETAMNEVLGDEYADRVLDFAAAIKDAFGDYFGLTMVRSNDVIKENYIKVLAAKNKQA